MSRPSELLWYRLAFDLGKTVGELKDSLSASELAGWSAVYKLMSEEVLKWT